MSVFGYIGAKKKVYLQIDCLSKIQCSLEWIKGEESFLSDFVKSSSSKKWFDDKAS